MSQIYRIYTVLQRIETGIHGTLLKVYSCLVHRNILFSSHPYLFFNQDGHTMTFMGLWVDKAGNLIDFKNKTIIQSNFMDQQLRQALEINLVSFQENYSSWTK